MQCRQIGLCLNAALRGFPHQPSQYPDFSSVKSYTTSSGRTYGWAVQQVSPDFPPDIESLGLDHVFETQGWDPDDFKNLAYKVKFTLFYNLSCYPPLYSIRLSNCFFCLNSILKILGSMVSLGEAMILGTMCGKASLWWTPYLRPRIL